MSTEILQFVTQFTLYSGCIAFVLGLFGNAFNILVFTQMKMFHGNQCAFYLTIESISSFFYQFVPIAMTILTSIYGDDATGRSTFWCKFRYTYAQTFAFITFYTICFAAVDQFFSTNYRFNLRQMCTLKLARYLTFIFACLSFIHGILFGFSFDIEPLFGCVVSNPTWVQYQTYFLYPVFVGLLPVTIASVFGILAYRNVRHIIRRQIPIVRRRLDQQLTAMVLIRVILFVCLAAPNTFYRIYVVNFPISRTKPLEYAIGRLIQALLYFFNSLNYGISFYVFVISSARFRRQVKLVLIKKCWQRCKFWCGLSQNRVTPVNANSCVISLDPEENS